MTIDILGSTWEVLFFDRELPDGSSNWGLCHQDKKIIWIVRNSGDREQEIDTFFHELFHAVWHEYRRSNRETEEIAVTILAAGLSKALTNNPSLLQYLTQNQKIE